MCVCNGQRLWCLTDHAPNRQNSEVSRLTQIRGRDEILNKTNKWFNVVILHSVDMSHVTCHMSLFNSLTHHCFSLSLPSLHHQPPPPTAIAPTHPPPPSPCLPPRAPKNAPGAAAAHLSTQHIEPEQKSVSRFYSNLQALLCQRRDQ